MKSIKKRNWDIVEFDVSKIKQAIKKAFEATKNDNYDLIEILTQDVLQEASYCFVENIPTVEEIQDIVEKILIKHNLYEVSKAYIIYRQKKIEQRKEEKEEEKEKFQKHELKVTKSNWTQELFDIKKIKKTFDLVISGYEETCKFSEVESRIWDYIKDSISTKEITNILIKIFIDNISLENINWQFLAWRLKTLDIYKKASKTRKIEISTIYSWKNYLDLFKDYVSSWLYSKKFFLNYSEQDILKAWDYIKSERDFDYNFTQVTMFNKRYLLNPNKVTKELPQEMYMSIALFLAIPEKSEDRLDFTFKIYDAISTQKISLPTPTLLNARTNFEQLSSCFKISIDDDLRAIYHGIENMAQISKYGWWIWTYLWNIRSKGWSIRWVKWTSGWVVPWIKVINDTAIAVNQLGARAWSISVTLDVFHRDIYDFLDLQTETWDIRRKSFDVYPALSIPDLFMQRVEKDENWTLFDPKEITDITGKKLQDHFWAEFNKLYEELEKDSRLELKKEIKARDLFKKFLKTAVETGMPYVFFRDTVNNLNPNKHAWNIYSTQLCTEICQNMSPTTFIEETDEDGNINIKYKPWDFVVCNLASINVSKVNEKQEIDKIVPIAMRILDNVITLNFYPIKEAEITAKKYRSVWLGYLWLAEYLANKNLAYDSIEVANHTDELFEYFSYTAIKSSNEIAQDRWAYELFENSEWSKWIIFWKDEEWFKSNSQMSEKWIELIWNIKKDWLRFAYHIAPAPNTSTALVTGTTAALLPIYKKYFIENNMLAPSVMVAPNLNPSNFWYYKEYVHMDMSNVIELISRVYKWVDQSISFEWMIDPSRVSPQDFYNYYFEAWKKWIKTVYYVRSLSSEIKDNCVSCSG